MLEKEYTILEKQRSSLLQKMFTLEKIGEVFYGVLASKADDFNEKTAYQRLAENEGQTALLIKNTADEYGFIIDKTNINTNPFTGKYDDLTAGWVWNFTCEYNQTANCDNTLID